MGFLAPRTLWPAIRATFELSSEIEQSVRFVAAQPLLIFENFFKDPLAVRDLATSLDYGLEFGLRRYRNYPGERALISISIENVATFLMRQYASVAPSFSYMRRYVPRPVIFTRINSTLVDMTTCRQRVPHIDDDCVLAGVVYLTGDQERPVDGGTYFYEHRPTGLSYLPPAPSKGIAEIMRNRGFNATHAGDYRKFIKTLMFEGDENISGTGLSDHNLTWAVVEKVEYRFNRCVLFPARLFHSPVYAPAQEISSLRLTQNLFFTPR